MDRVVPGTRRQQELPGEGRRYQQVLGANSDSTSCQEEEVRTRIQASCSPAVNNLRAPLAL